MHCAKGREQTMSVIQAASIAVKADGCFGLLMAA
jgi:hypothetical protein